MVKCYGLIVIRVDCPVVKIGITSVRRVRGVRPWPRTAGVTSRSNFILIYVICRGAERAGICATVKEHARCNFFASTIKESREGSANGDAFRVRLPFYASQGMVDRMRQGVVSLINETKRPLTICLFFNFRCQGYRPQVDSKCRLSGRFRVRSYYMATYRVTSMMASTSIVGIVEGGVTWHFMMRLYHRFR